MLMGGLSCQSLRFITVGGGGEDGGRDDLERRKRRRTRGGGSERGNAMHSIKWPEKTTERRGMRETQETEEER